MDRKNDCKQNDRTNNTIIITSFGKLRELFHLKPFTKRTSDHIKLKKQREKFLGKCKVCHKPMEYIKNTNVLKCGNPDCSGFLKKSKDGIVSNDTVIRLLNRRGAEIAETLFENGNMAATK